MLWGWIPSTTKLIRSSPWARPLTLNYLKWLWMKKTHWVHFYFFFLLFSWLCFLIKIHDIKIHMMLCCIPSSNTVTNRMHKTKLYATITKSQSETIKLRTWSVFLIEKSLYSPPAGRMFKCNALSKRHFCRDECTAWWCIMVKSWLAIYSGFP